MANYNRSGSVLVQMGDDLLCEINDSPIRHELEWKYRMFVIKVLIWILLGRA